MRDTKWGHMNGDRLDTMDLVDLCEADLDMITGMPDVEYSINDDDNMVFKSRVCTNEYKSEYATHTVVVRTPQPFKLLLRRAEYDARNEVRSQIRAALGLVC